MTRDADAAEKIKQPMGLYVRNGTLMRAGKAYAGIGANYDTLFGRLVQDKDNSSSLTNLGLLAKKGIPFVRFRAGGFWPQNWQLYLQDRAEYFRRLDLVVHTAEQHRIGLIPSLFWKLGTVPRLVGESAPQLGDPGSKSIAFIKRYTKEVVGRYKDSPAIWGWEFGNEANLGVALSPVGQNTGRRPSSPDAETVEPDGGGRLTFEQLINAYRTFAQTVRSIDPSRVIDPGTSAPRPGAWHSAHGQGRQRDGAEQTYEMLSLQTPDPMNLTSVHIYTKPRNLAPYGPETVSHFIARFAAAAAESGKPLFIGEFPVQNRAQATEYLQAIKEGHVPLSAFWVFDHASQEAHMNISFENERSFVLDMVAIANRELASPGAGSR